MMKSFQMSTGMRFGNTILKSLLRLGFPMGPLRLLTHYGRKSGNVYTTPVALVEDKGTRWLVAAFGEVNWVRNVRAAGEATLKSGFRNRTFHIVEIDNQSAAPILKQFLKKYGKVPFIPPYFNVTPDSPIADFEHEAQYHPVFRIEPKSG